MKIDCLRVCVCVHVCLFIYISNKIQNLAAVFLDSFSDLPSSFWTLLLDNPHSFSLIHILKQVTDMLAL